MNPDTRTAVESGSRTHSLDPLLKPQSIALLGASQKPNTVGNDMVRNALAGGFAGAIYPVNPKYDVIEGLDCFASLRTLPETVDHVALAVANERLGKSLTEVVEHGAKAATIFGSCFLENDSQPVLSERLRDIALEAGLVLSGGNGMGFSNLEIGLHVSPFPFPHDAVYGPIAWISQSGSVYGALAYNDRRLRFNICISSGAELVVTAADYFEWCLRQPSTRVIGLFLESVRKPALFECNLAEAAGRDIPVVALKAGRTAASAEMARTHTGAVAGNDAAYRALFDKYGVIRVESLDELAAALMTFASPRRAQAGGLASIHDSGGECELLMDMAEKMDIRFAKLGEQTRKVLADNLEPGLAPVNPLDAWGSGRNGKQTTKNCFAALMQDPDTAAGLVVCDARDAAWHHDFYFAAAEAAMAQTGKPVAVATNYSMLRHKRAVERLTAAEIPLVDGTWEALRAVSHLFAYRDFGERPDPAPLAAPAQDVIASWRETLAGHTQLDASSGMALLADFGVPTAALHLACSAEQAERHAGRLGYPVVLKTAANIDHKSDAGGVYLNLHTAVAVREAYESLSGAFGDRVFVSPMLAGVEIGIGAVNDPQFGPFVMVAAGGTLIELLDDNAVTMAPCDEHAALRLIGRLRVKHVLDGVRGQPAADVSALAQTLSRLSILAYELKDVVGQIDINPLIVTPDGCMAVDALVVPRF